MKVRLTKAAEKHLQACLNGKVRKCVACERPLVEGEQVRRGQCVACYASTRNAIKDGRIEESSLIQQGRLLVKQKGGRPPVNAFTAALARGELS